MRRTNADKRRAVLRLIEDAEWVLWSDREISRRCGVSDRMVNGLRPNLPASAKVSQIDEAPRSRTVERGGTVYQQNTAKIGSAPRPPAPAWTPADVPAPSARDEQIARDNANRFISMAL